MSQTGQYEVVMLFGADEQIGAQMHYSEFEALTCGGATLDAHAATQTRAVYCVIGNGLTLRGVVFFQFSVDEEGRLDPSFNVPLRYLVRNAGAGPELDHGVVRKASRAQCPVPWHSVNLWEPEDPECIHLIQSRIYRNKLKLKSSLPGAQPFDAPAVAELQEVSATGNGERRTQAAELNHKLTQAFGEQGKVSLQDMIRMHAEQLQEAKLKYRSDIEEQQNAYLDQLRSAREEIHELKVALRQEQGRNRRLQQMLRGEV